ncbi:Alpha/Beta hydrolase protein [Lactarius hatsudake]|nr:Alpha/Beta hydrolase protein [Lactarius hatsudake]
MSYLFAMNSEQPFKIAVSDDALALLKRKLKDIRLPDEVNTTEWAYGTPLADIRRLRELNPLPMFARTITVDGFGELKVHYVYQRSTAKGAILLLFVHGRPGSFVEATKIPPLVTPVSADCPSFHIVAPSLPGFPWSEGVLEKGFHAEHYAKLFNKLMISLGYSEYVTQGGDWGYSQLSDNPYPLGIGPGIWVIEVYGVPQRPGKGHFAHLQMPAINYTSTESIFCRKGSSVSIV